MPVRIILADDHAMFREGLRLLLERAEFKVVGEAENGVDLIALARSLRPQVVVTDLSMPLMNGIEAAAAIRRELGIPGILLTMHTDAQYVLRAMSTGLMGYVLKSKASACLVEAVREVAAGNVYLSPGASNTVLRGMLTKTEVEEPLTARERQVLQLIAEGYTTKEIAHFMTITVRTGESHRASLMDKLNIHNTAGLVRYALKQGLAQL
jgi:DNA-binding NarL/FixJ family response regulator